MTSTKRAIRPGPVRLGWAKLGPFSVVALMVLWGVLVIGPAALPH
jgi:hypothetical protein